MGIKEFFENQEVFLTGGSGFIGKVLIEKILYSCPKVSKIFVMIRERKGKNAEERLKDILSSAPFRRLREDNPEILNRVYAISGDCSELGLGISKEDLLKIKNVTIIYHSAASVRFDDALRDAILLNTRGTFELIKIAETLKKLKVFVHVSTTYCNPDKFSVEEKVYPSAADWRTSIKLAETYSTDTLNILNAKYNGQPNTYTFTKSLSEQIINEYKDKLPLVIFRPSIIVSSLIEPIPGWIDNFNGPLGMLVACGVGIMRTNYADPDIVSDFVPVDIVVRAMLITAYKKGTESLNPQDNKELEVFNCATANVSPIKTGQMIEMGKKLIRDNPFEKTLWLPGGSITRCYVWHLIRFLTLQILMAILVDSGLRLSKEKPFLLKLQRKIYAANQALYYFLTNCWEFKNEKFVALHSLVPKSEFNEFGFMQFAEVKHEVFMKQGIRGAKEFLLKETPESSRGAFLRLRIFQVLHYLIQFTGSLFLLRFIARYVYTTYF